MLVSLVFGVLAFALAAFAVYILTTPRPEPVKRSWWLWWAFCLGALVSSFGASFRQQLGAEWEAIFGLGGLALMLGALVFLSNYRRMYG